MPSFVSSMMLATFGLVLYNIAQKNQPAAVHPFQILSVAYLIAAIVSVTIYRAMPDMGTTSLKGTLLPAAGLGIAVIFVELGFMSVYRSGWGIGLASAVSNVAAATVLLPIGVFFLHDKIAPVNMFGITLCLFGLFFVTR